MSCQMTIHAQVIHQLFKWYILMLIRLQCCFSHLSQQINESRIVAQITSYCQCIDKESNQSFNLFESAIGNSCTNHNIFLLSSSVTIKQYIDGCQQYHE